MHQTFDYCNSPNCIHFLFASSYLNCRQQPLAFMIRALFWMGNTAIYIFKLQGSGDTMRGRVSKTFRVG